MAVTVSQCERRERLDADRRKRFEILDRIGEAFKDVPAEEIERRSQSCLRRGQAREPRAACCRLFMTRVVLDVNVLASGVLGFLQPSYATRFAASCLAGRQFSVELISEHILTNLQRTLTKTYFQRRLTLLRSRNAVPRPAAPRSHPNPQHRTGSHRMPRTCCRGQAADGRCERFRSIVQTYAGS